jgi:hypothetical protein
MENETKVEKKPVKEINYIDPITAANDEDVVTHIGVSRGASTKYGVVFPVFSQDGKVDFDLMKERYNMSELELVQAGIRQLSTRPNYDSAFGADGSVDHAKLQEIADNYKPGSRVSAGPKVTKEAAKMGRMVAKEAGGLSTEEIMEAIAAAKAKKGL